ncbi:MAG: twin-arginine translocase subunit TatC [Nitrospirae bacterium CG18_big_fil_WC_8_21_14_2_50_70_55]|nr:twin-arginine translocase subunit TatC [Deltaproteobacteria bacterium]OIP64719.1 MAG: twin arginine-targeting protein translocase TatC [Nitrospirae bacterium CG2_30_70_394]PIQ03866.1 MAG: twin-arginine translocase subunit TatC [Nitrospirae bacterium CG18_big_fil_WC_8_21_14_2_50_70_55]PIU79861.1 MAG: twin-arginine translocase subunit TatC [Nitrospirae bacterium CG06_land_8_20_14_3_00_70_43]PIW82524.1 MAG: twin-arginine translocase subunit TatC [Nitrospirae bacterium CG_4_8_14_3_um_filter_70_8
MADVEMPLTGHLEELRARLLWAVAALGIGFAASYAFSARIITFMEIPLKRGAPDTSLNYFSLMEPFITHLKAAFFAGLLLALPVIFYQLYRFAAPGLLPAEKRYVIPFVLFATLFFLAGAALAFAVVLPYAVAFFLHFDPTLIATLNVSKYLGFAITMMITFGLIFQLPVVVFVLTRLGLLSPEFMTHHRRYAILATFIIGAILTPPDPVTQCLLVVPLLVMYELSVWVARAFYTGRAEAPAAEGQETSGGAELP